jgi:hypothetical protein
LYALNSGTAEASNRRKVVQLIPELSIAGVADVEFNLARRSATPQCRRMRPISGTGILLALLFASVLSLAGLSGWYVFSVRQYRQIQSQLTAGEQNRARLKLLIADCLEYRKRNPAIDPVLQSVNLLRIQGTNAPAKASEPRP